MVIVAAVVSAEGRETAATGTATTEGRIPVQCRQQALPRESPRHRARAETHDDRLVAVGHHGVCERNTGTSEELKCLVGFGAGNVATPRTKTIATRFSMYNTWEAISTAFCGSCDSRF